MSELLVDLRREGAELTWQGRSVDLRAFSDRAWRRGLHDEINRQAYGIFTALCRHGAGPPWAVRFRDGETPLLPLFQREFTEALVAGLSHGHWLRPALAELRPARARAAPGSLPALQWAAGDLSVVAGGGGPGGRHAARALQNLARHALYLPRLAGQQRRWSSPPEQPRRRRLLFVVNYPNHLPSLLPLIRRLAEDGRFDVLVTGADTATLRRGDVDPAPLEALAVPYLPFDGGARWIDVAAALRQSLRVAGELSQAVRSPAFRHGLTLPAADQALALPVLADLVHTRLPKVLLYLRLARALLRRLQPALVVVTDETLPLLGRVALRAAQAQGIPTLTIQHGLLLDDPMYYGGVVAEHMALWGEAERAFLVDHGSPPERLSVVGSTRFGRPAEVQDPLDLPAALDLPRATQVVLFMSQPGGRDVSPAANLTTVIALARAVAAVPNSHLLVKPHPAQAAAELTSWRTALDEAGLSGSVSVRADLPLHPAMLAAGLCACVFSTTGLEALWLDRPLLTINLTDRPDPVPYGSTGAAVSVGDPADLPRCLDQALDPSDQAARAGARRALVAAYLGPQDGAALDRLAALVRDLAGP